MPTGQLLILGAIAGLTIYLGLPFAAMRSLKHSTRAVLNGLATGILLFVAIEILGKVFSFAEGTVEAAVGGSGTAGSAVGVLVLVVVGLSAGLVGIPLLEKYMIRPLADRSIKRGAQKPGGIGALGPAGDAAGTLTATSNARTMAITIAAGIGLHNFGEGLAIGQSAASGAVSLALLLVVGFGLHNMTEGFGVAAPLSGTSPSFGFIAGAGLLAGGPTFLGTLIGSVWTSAVATAIFLSVAGGSLVYVSVELAVLERKSLRKIALMASIGGGLLTGYLTDLVVTLGGA